jgi:hypothetical protein
MLKLWASDAGAIAKVEMARNGRKFHRDTAYLDDYLDSLYGK